MRATRCGWVTARWRSAFPWYASRVRPLPVQPLTRLQRPTGAYALHVYVPRARVPDAPASWGAAGAPPALLQAALSAAEPRLTKLAALARPAALVAYAQHETLDEDDWVLPRAPCAALGDAAHPMPPGSIQAAALSIEDAAVFARLFARLRRPAQVPGLLATFGMLRAERTRLTHAADAENIAYLSLAHGAGAAEARDDKLRENLRSGRGAIGGTDPDDAGVQAQWIQILTTWGYDAEDDADNWWVKWGALGEPADVPMLDLGAAIRVDVRAEPT
jgi:salicylate hydroxylase